MNVTKGNGKCRVFLKDLDGTTWQLFSLSQNKNDGSIYLGSLEFTSFEWLTFKLENDELNPFKLTQNSDGHLSIHASGQTRITSSEHDEKLIVDGHHLLKKVEKDISLRHLFTMFPRQPIENPKSEAGARKSDVIINTTKKLRPFVMLAYALPRVGLNVNLQMSFCIDDLEPEDIPGILGIVTFPLIHHDIFVVIYRTKFMNDWPKKHMLQYADGVILPMFFGENGRKIKVNFVMPDFSLNNKELSIKINCARED
ncbi:MAG: hypothetical protein M1324_04445 [Patescibacteria group bacterium]|nr:hypothetical protein [Patescibacteria group bacterium]